MIPCFTLYVNYSTNYRTNSTYQDRLSLQVDKSSGNRSLACDCHRVRRTREPTRSRDVWQHRRSKMAIYRVAEVNNAWIFLLVKPLRKRRSNAIGIYVCSNCTFALYLPFERRRNNWQRCALCSDSNILNAHNSIVIIPKSCSAIESVNQKLKFNK